MKAKMWLIIIGKLFCMHEWKSHAKKENHYTETTEVLICENCGKVKVIKY